jgi:hypothetical protein
MWDPISIFACMWILNTGLPDARLKVADVVEKREQQIIIDNIADYVKLREGI